MQTIELLAILGRGIRQKESGSWTPTRDLEMYDENFAPIVKLLPADDADPNCLIGGGELNLLAGRELCRQHTQTLEMIVCAYGARSPYLVSTNGPSESEVMSEQLKRLVSNAASPEIVIWRCRRIAEGNSNTNREIQNVFELAAERGLKDVGIVTVAVHYARSLLMAQRHLINPSFAHLKIQFFVSEDILLRLDPARFGERIRKMHGSQAFMRTLFFEQRGINCLLAGNY